jgi:thioredoxin 1
MREITAAEFETEVIDSDIPVLVDFSASWCGPCKAMEPVLKRFAEEVAGLVKCVKIDVDDAHELAQEYAIRSVPNLILFKNGLEIRQHIGSASKEVLLKMVG